MSEIELGAINNVGRSVFEETYNNVGEGFKEILSILDSVNTSGGNITVTDTLQLQQAVFKYTMHQELITKIASKSANAINEVMKAQ